MRARVCGDSREVNEDLIVDFSKTFADALHLEEIFFAPFDTDYLGYPYYQGQGFTKLCRRLQCHGYLEWLYQQHSFVEAVALLKKNPAYPSIPHYTTAHQLDRTLWPQTFLKSRLRGKSYFGPPREEAHRAVKNLPSLQNTSPMTIDMLLAGIFAQGLEKYCEASENLSLYIKPSVSEINKAKRAAAKLVAIFDSNPNIAAFLYQGIRSSIQAINELDSISKEFIEPDNLQYSINIAHKKGPREVLIRFVATRINELFGQYKVCGPYVDEPICLEDDIFRCFSDGSYPVLTEHYVLRYTSDWIVLSGVITLLVRVIDPEIDERAVRFTIANIKQEASATNIKKV